VPEPWIGMFIYTSWTMGFIGSSRSGVFLVEHLYVSLLLR